MKRLSPPEKPRVNINLDETEVENKMEKVEPKLEKVETVLPKSKVYKNLKRLSSFKQLKTDYKLQSQKDVFIHDVTALLQHLDKSDHKLDVELLIEVLNACEEFFVYGDTQTREKVKYEAIHSLMGEFFESPIVLDQFVNVLQSKIKKSTFLRRVMKKMYNFFL